MSVTATSNEINSLPGIAIRRVPVEAPWQWLEAGWRDMWVRPTISLSFGAIFAVLAIVLFTGLWFVNIQSLILAMAGGFLLIGPAFAVGLYDLSRRIEAGNAIDTKSIYLSGLKVPGQLGFLGAILGFIYLLWIQIAFLLFMLFFGNATSFPPASQFIATLLFQPHGLGLLITGTIVGAVLAAISFSTAVISVPLVTVRRIDSISAIHVSLQAVAHNFAAMALWAALIGAIIALGFATCAVGLVIAFPLIGHASWHAFRDIVKLD